MKLIIPLHKQEIAYTCVPACLKMVLSYSGEEYGEKFLAENCNTTTIGTSADDAVSAAEKLGFSAFEAEGSLDILNEYLRHKVPVIVYLRTKYLSWWIDDCIHALIVTDLCRDKITLIDPSFGKEFECNIQTFYRSWKEIDNLCIIIKKI